MCVVGVTGQGKPEPFISKDIVLVPRPRNYVQFERFRREWYISTIVEVCYSGRKPSISV